MHTKDYLELSGFGELKKSRLTGNLYGIINFKTFLLPNFKDIIFSSLTRNELLSIVYKINYMRIENGRVEVITFGICDNTQLIAIEKISKNVRNFITNN